MKLKGDSYWNKPWNIFFVVTIAARDFLFFIWIVRFVFFPFIYNSNVYQNVFLICKTIFLINCFLTKSTSKEETMTIAIFSCGFTQINSEIRGIESYVGWLLETIMFDEVFCGQYRVKKILFTISVRKLSKISSRPQRRSIKIIKLI